MLPCGSTTLIELRDEVSHASQRTFWILKVLTKLKQALLEVLICANEVFEEKINALVKEDKVVDGMPPELALKRLAKGGIYGIHL